MIYTRFRCSERAAEERLRFGINIIVSAQRRKGRNRKEKRGGGERRFARARPRDSIYPSSKVICARSRRVSILHLAATNNRGRFRARVTSVDEPRVDFDRFPRGHFSTSSYAFNQAFPWPRGISSFRGRFCGYRRIATATVGKRHFSVPIHPAPPCAPPSLPRHIPRLS